MILGDSLDTDRINASDDAGVLTPHMPIRERAKPWHIEINSNGSAPKRIDA